MPIQDNRPGTGGGGGGITSINGNVGPAVVITKTTVGLANVDNTSDLNKPISTLQQAALDTKVSLVASPDIEPNNFVGYNNYSSDDFFFRPLQNSPDESWNIFDKEVIIDPDPTGFTMGTNGLMANIFNLNFNHKGTSDIGGLAYFSLNSDIGNGVDAIDVNGLSLVYGFGNIDANVTMSGPIQGYGFQINMAAGSFLNDYSQAFYDAANYQTSVAGHTSFNATPTILDVKNNTNVTGFNASPSISSFSGNSGYTGFAMNGTFGGFGTGGMSGLSLNPTVTDAQYYNGVYSSTQNVSVYAGSLSALTFQDLFFEFLLPANNNNFTIEYTTGGTAGAEVVTVAVPVITVQIEDGVSTANQVQTALQADPTVNSNISITLVGVGTNPQIAAGPTNFAGGSNPGNKYAGYFEGDVNITGDLTFGGALSVGLLSAFGSFEVIDGGGNPSSAHSLISSITSANGSTVNNCDTFGINTAALIDVGDSCTLTAGFLGLGFTALGLPAVLKIGANSYVDAVGGAVFAISYDAASGVGSHLAQGWGGRFLAIPNGITLTDRFYGIWTQFPLGVVATDNWGLYLEDAEKNFIEGSLKIGGVSGVSDFAGPGLKLHVLGDAYIEGTLSADDIAIVATQVDCLDNATEIITIGSANANEMYELSYSVQLNVSGVKRSGHITLGYDGAIFFDDEENYSGNPIAGLDIQPSVSGGNLRIEVSLAAVGENSKIRYVTRKVDQIV